MSDASLPSTTTIEENLHSAFQRRINLIWEFTQAYIAVMVVTGAIAGTFWFASTGVPTLLGNAFFLIVGFYFGRTNHRRDGAEAPVRS